MIGCPVALKWAVACRFGEESQQPTWPHVRHRRSDTHSEPLFKQSSQPSALGVTSRISFKCLSVMSSPLPMLAQKHVMPRRGSPKINTYIAASWFSCSQSELACIHLAEFRSAAGQKRHSGVPRNHSAVARGERRGDEGRGERAKGRPGSC